MAKLPSNISLSQDEVRQDIEVSDWLGVEELPADLALAIGQEMADYIKSRAQDGKGIGGTNLKSPYSERYAESLDFKAAGKSKGDVNMTLSGSMLDAIDVDSDGQTITIAINDSAEAPKAYGHMTGFEGHPTIPNGAKYRRQFFGLNKKEFDQAIKPLFREEIRELRREERSVARETVNEIRTLGDLFSLVDED